MPKFKTLLSATVLFSATLTCNNHVVAASNGVHFGGDQTNNAFCIIFVDQGGTLKPNIEGTQLSSKLPGGIAGQAEVWSFRAYDISVSAPSFFDTRPVGGDDGTSFTALYSGQSIYRGRTFAEQDGNSKVRLRGRFSRTQVTINMIADKPDSFPAGDYSAHTVLRCE